MKILGALLGLMSGLLSSAAMAQPADPLEASVEAVVTRFEQAYRDCGLTPPFSAVVEIQTHPGLISYSNAGRKVRVSRYEELALPLQDQMTAWAGPVGASDGADLFHTIFQRLGTAHEMGHWEQHISRRFLSLDQWDRELEANRIAIAFWSMVPADAVALETTVNGWLSIMSRLPSPVPEGADARDHFTRNYDAIASNPAQYGWYQAQFLGQAWARREEVDFCDLARLNAPAPIEAFAAEDAPPRP